MFLVSDRPYPFLIEDLCGVPIIKVVAGNHHSLALTSYCQVSKHLQEQLVPGIKKVPKFFCM